MRSTFLIALVALGVTLALGPSCADWIPSEVDMNAADLEARAAGTARPRLYLQDGGLEELRAAIRTTHREQWADLKAAVDQSLERPPPDYRPPRVGGDPTRPGTLNDEMLWQRVFGYHLPGLALVAALDPDPKYFEAARAWALKPEEYEYWGAGLFDGADLAAAHLLFGISFAYDVLYDRWSPEDRERLRSMLAERGRWMHEAATGVNDLGWWKDEWRQNHSWCAYQALGVTAIALAGDEPGTGEWLKTSIWGFQHIVRELPDEGAYEEGVPYWGYGMEGLMRFITAVRPYSDEDFYGATYLRNTPLFRMHMAGPRMGQVANFGDGPARDWHAIRPIMYRLASEYRDPVTQWLAESLPDRHDVDATCWSLLWYDATLEAQAPNDLPTWHAFQGTGFASARTSWDEDALTLHLRSGRTVVSHSHLDINNFLLNAGGEWLLRDYGYGTVGEGYFNREVIYFNTSTWAHNAVVIGGQDQRTDEDSGGTITDAVEQDGVVWIRSDATKAYDGAESVVRELALVMPHAGTGKWGYVVVRDRARTQSAQTFDFMLQPGGDLRIAGDTFVIEAEHSRLAGRVLAPSSMTMSVSEGIGDRVNVDSPRTLRISARGEAREMEFVVVLVPLAEGEEAPEIAALGDGAVGARVGTDRLVFSGEGTTPPQLGTD